MRAMMSCSSLPFSHQKRVCFWRRAHQTAAFCYEIFGNIRCVSIDYYVETEGLQQRRFLLVNDSETKFVESKSFGRVFPECPMEEAYISEESFFSSSSSLVLYIRKGYKEAKGQTVCLCTVYMQNFHRLQ